MTDGGIERVRLQLLAGVAPDDAALGPRARRGLRLARRLGAPLLPAVEAAAEAEDDARRVARAVAVSTAQARTVARGLVLATLLLAPLVGRLAGVDAVAFYLSAGGRGVLVAGVVLLAAGGLLARGLIARASRPSRDADVEEVAELLAVALTGGAATTQALREVADLVPARTATLRRLALDLDLAVGRPAVARAPGAPGARGAGGVGGAGGGGIERVREVLALTSELGAPAAPTLRRLASDLRAAKLARVMAAAERLPAQLTVPTTLLLLPATVMLVGAPLVAAGLSAVLP